MSFKWEYLAAGASSIVVLMLVWFAGPIFHVTETNALVLRSGILLLGVICIAGILLWARSQRPALPSTPVAQAPPISATFGRNFDDLEILIREAVRKVSAARLAAGAKFSSLPAVFLVGETGAGKTSTMDQCGLDAELLAGQVFQENTIVPTRLANLWFARKTIFVEAGGPLVDDPSSWERLVKHFVPGRFRSIFSRTRMAPRAAVVCVDCEKLIEEKGLDKIVTQSRKVRARLEQLSHQMGVSLPVYVLFNHSDGIKYFQEFSGILGGAETSQVLGTTLPLMAAAGSGVYAEQETRRLTAAFHGLFFSLAECRVGLLHREREAVRQGGIYEFPREFRKLSTAVVQFLVDLCRPAHLRTGPFLRGFYFVGQRAATLASAGSETMPGTRSGVERAPGGFSGAATSLMKAPELAIKTKTAWPGGTQWDSAVEAHKAVQRVFLSHIFSHIVLQDRTALGTSGVSTRGKLGRRILLGTMAGLAIIWMTASITSFIGNRNLVNGVRLAAQDLAVVERPGSQVPAAEPLRRLDALRQALTNLRHYQQDGAPWHLRWGLYAGDSIFDDTRAIYFRSFDQLLFQHAKQNLNTDLRGYRGDQQASADSASAYDALKAYLLTTSEYRRNSGAFLQDFLMKEWKKDLGDLDREQGELVAQQFAFYSSELTLDNPYSKENQGALVEQVRAYLSKLAGLQRIYVGMLADARQKTKDYRFSLAHPDGLDVIRAAHDVGAPYTSEGWKVMDQNIQDAKRFLQGEPWVLGTTTSAGTSAAGLQGQLRTLYENSFILEWRTFLNSSSVVPLGDFHDSAQKLKKLSFNSSPLLALFCDVSDNTSVPSAAIKLAFQAPQQVVAPGCGVQKKYDQPSNDAYMKGLLSLQICIEQIAQAPADQISAVKASCTPVSAQALLAADQLAQGLTNDPEGHVDATARLLLEAPIKYIQARIAQGAGGTESLCIPYRTLQAGYPFNANGSREITLQELNAFFQPGTGRLSQFLNDLRSSLVLQGTTFVRAPGGTSPVGNRFLSFINLMYRIQQAIYPNSSPDPRFEYSVTPRLPSEAGYKSEKLKFDGQELIADGSGNSGKFVWPGSFPHEATLILNNGGADAIIDTKQGTWAVARLLQRYRWSQAGGGLYRIENPLLGPAGQPQRLTNGQEVIIRFDVDFKDVPVFQAGFLSGYSCPAKMAQ